MQAHRTAEISALPGLTPTVTFVLAFACALTVANLYYAQPLIALIGSVLDVPAAAIGLFVTLTQIGYGLGLLLIVPLGDLIENRKLIVVCLGVATVALAAMAAAHTAAVFLAATFALGCACTAIQVLLPYSAHFTTEAERGRVIGTLTSGLMLGIMLARPTASLIAHDVGWRAVFALAAAAMAVVAIVLGFAMPPFQPRAARRYLDMLRSLPPLLRDLPVLRRRAAYHMALYASFSLFWTAVPLLLASSRYGLSQEGIGLFALAGTGGVVIAPVAGWIADRSLTRPATGFAILAVIVAFVISIVACHISSIALLVAAAILIDAGLVVNFVLSQRSIYAQHPESRSRSGGLFTAIFFLGGAVGSSGAAASFVGGGWPLTAAVGLGFAVVALILYGTEFVERAAPVRLNDRTNRSDAAETRGSSR
jgi:predicted MFS family arabinose efflux permease